MAIDLFEKRSDIQEEKLHPKFTLLRDNEFLFGERAIISQWADSFTDRDNKIVKEFQTTFHSVIWELFLHSFFQEAGFSVDYSKNRPDFIIQSPEKIFVEAVVSEVKHNGRAEVTRGMNDMLEATMPIVKSPRFYEIIDEAVTRHSNSIRHKSKKYLDEYLSCSWVDSSTPFVIALGSYDQIDYGREFHHSMMNLLYGKKYDTQTGAYSRIKFILKPGTQSPIPVGIFNTPEFSHISAIIFSCVVTLGKLTSLANSSGNSSGMNTVFNIMHDFDPPHFVGNIVSPDSPEYLSDGVFIFHNNHASHPLPDEFFKNTCAVSVYSEEGSHSFYGENRPIVQRINMPKPFLSNGLVPAGILLDFLM